MKVLREENGQMLILTVLSMTVLFGFLAFATDVGLMFRARRNAQIAADAAATAGAIDINYGSTNAIALAAGQTAATNNGFTNGSNGTVVAINTPPAYGYHTSTGYVEAIIQEPNPTIFMNMLGFHSMTVAARAVAGPAGYSHQCMWLMNKKGTDLYLQGSATIEALNGTTTCSIYINSSDPDALDVKGNGNVIKASSINVVGGEGGNGGVSAPVYTGVTAENPPNLPTTGPDPSTCKTTYSKSNPIPPISAGPLDAGGGAICFTVSNPDMSGYAMNNGTFIFENGVTLGNSAGTTLGGANGATLDVYQGAMTMGPNTSLTAPTAGAYNGISLLVPATNTTYPANTTCKKNNNDPPELELQFGSNSTSLLNGMIVAPNATVDMHDQGGNIVAAAFYAGALCSYPSTLILPNYSEVHPITTPLKVVSLVE
jgi:Putative Flp pilus-assembly TadE/G-like